MSKPSRLKRSQEAPQSNHPPLNPLLDDTSLGIVASLVRLYLPPRELVRLQLLSKEWQTWFFENATSLWKARTQDELWDWYFPTWLSTQDTQKRSLYGVHHPSEQVNLLPDLDFLQNWKVKLLAGASGLLLLNKWDSNDEPKLLVCNPLTKKWRELPLSDPLKTPHMEEVLNMNLNALKIDGGFHVCMVVDDKSNSYEVVVMVDRFIHIRSFDKLNGFIYIYNSQSNLWSTMHSPEPSSLPEASPSVDNSCDNFTFGSICLNGHIYLVQMVGDRHVVAKMFLVQSRTWLPNVITLFDKGMYQEFFGERKTRGPTLVACLGEIYAIVPIQVMIPSKRGSGYVRTKDFNPYWRFEILKLQEKKFAFCATLPIKAEKFDTSWSNWIDTSQRPGRWYRCTARGSVIWLAYSEQLLKFDVITGCCTVLDVNAFKDGDHYFLADNFVPYSPSFHGT